MGVRAELGEVERDSAIPMVHQKRDSRDFPDSEPLSRPSTEVAGLPRASSARRFVIRLIGFAAVGAGIWGAAYVAREPRARAEIASWGTMGNPRIASTAARGVRSVVDTVRSIGK